MSADPRRVVDGGNPTGARAAEGWFGPRGSKRFHYFNADLRALCGKWMLWAHPEDAGLEWGDGDGLVSGDCVECSRRLAKREDAARG